MLRLASCCLLIAACGGDPETPAVDATAPPPPPPPPIDGRVPDAPVITADLACLGQPPPPPPRDPVELRGQVLAVVDYAASPVVGAAVALHRADDGGVVAAAITDAEGRFAITAAPIAGYYTATADGVLPSRVGFDLPVPTAIDTLIPMAGAAELARWYADAGARYAPGARTVLATIRDCALDTVAGATVAVAPTAGVVYYDVAAMRWDPALAATTNGFAIVPAAAAAVTATVHAGASAFPAEPLAAAPDELTIATVTPYD